MDGRSVPAADGDDPAPDVERDQEPPRLRWRLPLLLFLATVVTTMSIGREWNVEPDPSPWSGWRFAVPLLAILLAHEFGHYTFARLRGVRASLPHFIPMPIGVFGTMGAVIRMEAAKSRNALLDVGASGPLAGLVVAIPVLAYGLTLSKIGPQFPPGHGGFQEGQSILYWLMKMAFVGDIPAGQDVILHPTAGAGWVGLLVTMINLIPVGQLDGGHVAYALLGPRQDKLSNVIHALLPAVALCAAGWAAWRAHLNGWAQSEIIGDAIAAAIPWLFWTLLLFAMRRFAGKKHPAVEPGELSAGRRAVAVVTLVLFALLFMPAWLLPR